jgi:hypothetical protein
MSSVCEATKPVSNNIINLNNSSNITSGEEETIHVLIINKYNNSRIFCSIYY